MPTAKQMQRKEEKYRRMDSAEREICEQKEAQKWRERFEYMEAKRLERQEKEYQRQIDARQAKLERRTRRWILQAGQQSAENDMY
jgi:poly(3-hydroxyalkanoate) synthetase